MSPKSCTFAVALEGDAEIVLQPSISTTYQNGIQTYAPETAGTPEIFPFGGIPHTRVAVLCMEIEHLSGKEAIELVRAHKGQ